MKIYYINGELAHGIHIKEYKKTNWKYIYNRGYIMRLYKKCPKIIRFKSGMVNDLNQDLCGGWSTLGPNEDEITFNQIVNKRKPFAFMSFGEKQKNKAYEFKDRFDSLGIINEIKNRDNHGYKIIDLLVCQNMYVKDIGNFDDLKEDYANAIHRNFPKYMEEFRNYHLLELIDDWDDEEIVPLWLKGLMLGYPIENTISIYLQ